MDIQKCILAFVSANLLLTDIAAATVTDTISATKDTVAGKNRTAMSADNGFYGTAGDGMAAYVPKAPNAAGLVQYVDCPVSYYTGTPEISIPLYEIDAQGVKIPITLTYHASGVRVAQEATWVGLGWNLSCGGMVARTVKCSDDFHEYADSYEDMINQGYYDAPEAKAPLSNDYFNAQLYGDTKLQKDSEPDIFFYSIPGVSGKFMIDKSRGPVLLSRIGASNVKIELSGSKTGEHGSYTFIITDVYGNRFYFEKKEITWSYSRGGDLNQNKLGATVFDETENTVKSRYEAPMKYTSSWLLTQILTARGQSINFTYAKESYQLPTQEAAVKYNYIDGWGSGGTTSGTKYSCNKTVVEGYRLTNITWNGGSVTFDASPREDLKTWESGYTPQKLDRITVKNNLGDVVKQYAFSYTYMNGTRTDNYAHVFKRLMLNILTDCLDTSIKYSMTYYDDHSLPAKNSKNTDYWGYSNGKSQGSEYYCSASYNGQIFFGADKTGNLSFMRTGTLETLTYPTGEKESFIFETLTSTTAPTPVTKDISASLGVFKRYESDAYEEENFPETRTTTITIEESTNFEIWAHLENTTGKADKEYLYNNEAYPIFRIYRIKNNGEKDDNYWYSLIVPSELKTKSEYNYPAYICTLPKGTYSFEAYAPVNDLYIGVYFNYKATVLEEGETVSLGGLRIKEIRGTDNRTFTYEGGKLLVAPNTSYRYDENFYQDEGNQYHHEYLVQCSEPTCPMNTLKDGYIYGYDCVTERRSDGTRITYKYHNQPEEYNHDYPFIPASPNFYNGLPISETASKGTQPLKKTEYDYTTLAVYTVYGFVYRTNETSYHFYRYDITWPCLSKKSETTYETNGDFTKETSYTYNQNFQPMEESFMSDNKLYKRKMIYASDKTGSPYEDMKTSYMVGIPIETILKQNSQIISATKTEYVKHNDILLPSSESKTENEMLMSATGFSDYYNEQTTYSTFSTYGNPRVVTTNEEHYVILWGYNGMYPITVIKNCNYQQIETLLGDTMINSIENDNQLQEADLAALDRLRKDLPDADVTTITYKPLVGIISITDHRGFTTYYEYDTSGRLTEQYFKKDGNKHILKKYHYNYGGR